MKAAPIDDGEVDAEDEREDSTPDDGDAPAEEELHHGERQYEDHKGDTASARGTSSSRRSEQL